MLSLQIYGPVCFNSLYFLTVFHRHRVFQPRSCSQNLRNLWLFKLKTLRLNRLSLCTTAVFAGFAGFRNRVSSKFAAFLFTPAVSISFSFFGLVPLDAEASRMRRSRTACGVKYNQPGETREPEPLQGQITARVRVNETRLPAECTERARLAGLGVCKHEKL